MHMRKILLVHSTTVDHRSLCAVTSYQLCRIHFKAFTSLLNQHGIRKNAQTSSEQRLRARQNTKYASSSSVNDPGDWEYSPEWMGTQGGSWGHDAGRTVFSQLSHCGNGLVIVTSHAASHQEHPTGLARGLMTQEWRTMRFNEVTRQSVARVWQPVDGNSGGAVAQPDCLGMEYLKTMASGGAAKCLNVSCKQPVRSFITKA